MAKQLKSIFTLGVALSGVSAKADIFDFSITNTIGNVSGTVTGEIIGLTNNTTSAATQVLITSIPAGMINIFGPLPIDATTWDQQYQNSFTETNGQITGGGFWAQNTVNGDQQGDQLYINAPTNGFDNFNYVNLDGANRNDVWGDSGLAGAGLAPGGASTPEPTYLALVALGLGGLVFLKVRRNPAGPAAE